MHIRAIIERLKVVHWMWWAVWLTSVALLGLVIAKHPSAEVRNLAESFRPEYLVMPVHIILHRGIAEAAGWTLFISIILAGIAVSRPREAHVVLPLAVGLAVLFFAFHTLFYSHMMTEWMRVTVRERTSTP
ncbi:MAG: hypothetical protein ACKVY0_30720 [Prosthecobacter sp.]|uniref:hypothetical protein n=1 Tax=Prosthecobacter sp. TaxID=1965333 RepID=UPI0039007F82